MLPLAVDCASPLISDLFIAHVMLHGEIEGRGAEKEREVRDREVVGKRLP